MANPNTVASSSWTHRFLIALAFVSLAIAALGVNPFDHQTVTPFDLLITQSGWEQVDPHVSLRDGERSDVLDARLPQWTNARLQIRSGHLPLWNDKAAGGDVAFFNLSAGMFTPAFWLFALSPDPADGFYLGILFNLAVAGAGMYFFLRRRLGLVAALVGGATFELCGFHTAWLYWPHVLTSVWAPWLLLAVDRCAERPGMRSSVAVALFTAMVVLGGFPFVGMLVLAAGGLYILLLTIGGRGRSNWAAPQLAWYAAGSCLGFLFCALPLLGFIHWVSRFQLGYRHGGGLLGLNDWRLLFPHWAYATRRVEFTMYAGWIMALLAVMAVLGVALSIVTRRRIAPLPLFGASLLLIAAGLVFGFWPYWLVSKLPGFDSNIWTRAISILDLAIAILGACALDWLWHRDPPSPHIRWLAKCVLLLMAATQVWDISTFFHSYNGAVDKRFYYPRTPAITYMQDHGGPFDYVVADKSYLISGTLGAYGLREWFAHAFRSPALDRALRRMSKDPFSSATSSRLEGHSIKLASPAMTEFNVRYVVMDSTIDPRSVSVLPPRGTRHQPLPPQPTVTSWTQAFSLDQAAQIRGISFRTATYRESGLGGQLRLSLLDNNGAVLAQAQVLANVAKDNAFVDFYFDKPVQLPRGDYRFRVHYRPEGETRKLTAWKFVAGSMKPQLSVDGKSVDGSMEYVLHGEGPRHQPFVPVFSGDGETVYENRDSPRGPYMLTDIDDEPNSSSGDAVDVVSYRPDRFVLKYQGDSPGYLVVPMMMADGWHVTVDGRPAHVNLKAGFMPAIRLTKEASVTFQYRSRELALLWPWLISVALFLLGMYWAGHRASLRPSATA